ncbi:subtilisin-like protein [Byssothecium circinans]|uniref:Subtilisin-like protein n=1 Tax=Byssothecium circinans TaxID=147558 RepID=A0A6A5TJI7_9PLEO|nr:subtilisin-like protein [Byssothecium circinans]
MLSKYVGKDYGPAKKCSPVVVKVPFNSKIQVWLNGLSAVKQDVEARKVKKAVLSMSLYWPLYEIVDPKTGKTDEGWIDSVFNNLKELARLNVVLVAASGNDGIGNLVTKSKNVMDGYPALMGSPTAPTNRRIPSLIVVGAMHAKTGKIWPKSNFDNAKDIPHVYAPGEDVKCWMAKPEDTKFPHAPIIKSGTSLATASVAGLAAYFMSLPGGPTTPTAMKNKIQDTAWWSGNGGIAGTLDPLTKGMVRVWNEVTVESVKEVAQRAIRGADWR